MKKVIVIGCPGSGKTTFAEKLQKCCGDRLYPANSTIIQKITKIFSASHTWVKIIALNHKIPYKHIFLNRYNIKFIMAVLFRASNYINYYF